MMSRADRSYNVNMRRLALLALPTWLRRPLAGALLYAGIAPLGRLLSELRAYRSATGYRLRHNGQVCKLRGVLNDELDPASVEASTLWRREMGRWVTVPQRGSGAVGIYREGFAGTGGYDFWVLVPAELQRAEPRLRAIVNMYKLAGKRYAINYK